MKFVFLIIFMIFPQQINASGLEIFCTDPELASLKANISKEECLSKRPILNIGTSLIYTGITRSGTLLEYKNTRNLNIKKRFKFHSYNFLADYDLQQGIVKNGNVVIPHFLFTPKGEKKKRKTIIVRTPYLNRGVFPFMTDPLMLFKELDVNVLFQPARGTYLVNSKLEFLDVQNDIDDAKELLKWLENHKLYNGETIAYGFSYAGYLALTTVATNHPSIQAGFIGSPAGVKGYINTEVYYGHRNLHIENVKKSDKLIDNYLKKQLQDKVKRPYSKNELLNRENSLIEQINKTNIPLIFAYGQHHDHTSAATLNYFDKVRTPKYIYSFYYGHKSDSITHLVPGLNNILKEGESFRSLLNRFSRRTYITLDKELLQTTKSIIDDSEMNKETIVFDNFKKTYIQNEHQRHFTFIDPALYSGTYKVEIEFEKVTKETKGFASFSLYYLDEEPGTPTFELAPNVGFLEFKEGETKKVIDGNSVFFDVREKQHMLFFSLKKVRDFNLNAPKIKSVKLIVQKEHVK